MIKYLLPLLFMASCQICYTMTQPEEDPFIWLEEVESEKALDWVRAHNQKTLELLKSEPGFQEKKDATLEILNASDRIIYGTIRWNSTEAGD